MHECVKLLAIRWKVWGIVMGTKMSYNESSKVRKITLKCHLLCWHYIGVGRCSDLGGGGTFFLNNKNVISLRNNAYMQYCLQYCNTVYNTAMKFIM